MDTRSGETTKAACYCSQDSSLKELQLLDLPYSLKLEAMFKTLANSTRLRILHTLIREPRLCVTEIAHALDMRSQAISNQLQRMVDRGIVEPERKGNQIHYHVIDPCVEGLLDYGRCLVEDTEARLKW